MDNLDKILNDDLKSLTRQEAEKLLIDLRNEIDILDKSIVQMLNKRTLYAVYIGNVKAELDWRLILLKEKKTFRRKLIPTLKSL